MLRIKNNNIAFAKGESVCLEFQIAMNNGMPFIMPPLNNNIGILAFTVKSGISDDTVLAKYLNLTDIPIYSGEADLSEGGYCKFGSQFPLEFRDVEEMYLAYGFEPDSNGNNTNESPTNTQLLNRKRIAHCVETDLYYCWIQIDELSGKVGIYTFEFQIPILPEDTQNLDTKEYLYDICVYIGKYNESNNFPLSKIDWKMQLLRPHKLILEDSNNV